jgi:predicted glycogen debranching enzyme
MYSFGFKNLLKKSKEDILSLEWLEMNGLGGYASGTPLDCHTRRYHGLLVAFLAEPSGRFTLLSKFEDSLRLEDREYFFSCHQYPGFFFPEKDLLERDFFLSEYPVFHYKNKNVQIRKSLMMVYGENRILIRYELPECLDGAVLRLKPLLAFRNHHSLCHRNNYLRNSVVLVKGGFLAAPYDGMPSLIFQASRKASFIHDPAWLERFEYPEERKRGYDWHEDLFQPGIWEIPIREGQEVIISVGLSHYAGPLRNLWAKEEKRRSKAIAHHRSLAAGWKNEEETDIIERLFQAADDFMVARTDGKSAIIAGYPWFDQWGRDTLIALPGLTFCTGRTEAGIAILNEMACNERDGLFPNFFSPDGRPSSYNSVDTPLWYFWAIQQMLNYTGQINLVRDVHWPVMKNILRRFITGTAFEIAMQADGLLQAGTSSTNLTWMDAMVHGRPITPRWGCPVEINALWYNALCFAREMAGTFDDHEMEFEMIIGTLRQAFQAVYWIPEKGYLGDVFTDGRLDHAIRPNQILAVSLPHTPLEPHQQESIVRAVEKYLLTPVGLRTLAQEDPNYSGRYEGDSASRDSAYHQGTVWPWLMGHYGEAYLRISPDRTAAGSVLARWMVSFLQRHLPEAGIGTISEVFDGSRPHRAGGCIAQAWSVAELVRLSTILMQNTVTP